MDDDVTQQKEQQKEAGEPQTALKSPAETKPTSWKPQSMFDEMERMVGNLHELFPWQGRRWGMPPWVEELENRVMRLPSMDIIDHDSEVIVRAAVPGMKKEDLELSLTEHSISLSGKLSHEEKEEKANYVRSEIYRGDFSRTLRLPAEVVADQAKASFKDGVLEVVVPKKQPVERKAIPIE